MSLEDLNGPILHLVLSIKEGHGFGFLQTPMLVVASTSGLCLETEPVQPSPDPVIRTDLAWETDKKSLRGFRTSNTPVKVECFSVINDVKRDRIGYILLNIKSAQVVPSGKHTKLLEKCHRLINVPQEAKSLKPELLLCLKVTEAHAPVSTCASSCSGLSRTLPESPQSGKAATYSLLYPLANDFPLQPIFKPEENLVQIGPEEWCTDIFVLTLTFDKVGNLSLLIPKKSELSDTPKLVHLSCTIFSTSLTTKPINREFGVNNDVCFVDEHLHVKIFSSVHTLFRYFRENPSCPIQLIVGGREIAATELHLTSFLRTDDKMTFVKDFRSICTKSQKCTWISSFNASIPAAPSGGKPFVDVNVKLEFAENQAIDSDGKSQESTLIKNVVEISSQWSENIDSFVTENPFHESGSFNDDSKATVLKNSPAGIVVSDRKLSSPLISEVHKEMKTSEFSCVRSGATNIPFNSNPLISDDCFLHKYCLRVSLTSATFDRIPSSQRLRFRFDFPNGHVLSSSITDVVNLKKYEPIELADIGATIVIHSSPSDLVNEFRSGVIVVAISEVKSDLSTLIPFAKASLPISAVCLPGKVESAVTSVLEEESTYLQIGVVNAHLSLEDCSRRQVSSIRSQTQITDTDSPGHMASSHNYASGLEISRAVLELEQWKERQKEIFTAELKEKEAIFLEKANETWMVQKHQLEQNLDRNMAQCRSLAEALSAAREDLCQRSTSCLEKEEQLKHLKEDLERQYNAKFQELTMAAKRLDDGVKVKVMLTEARCSELEDRLKSLCVENEKLRQELEEEQNLRKKLLEKCAQFEEGSNSLNQQQVAKLLAQVKQLEEKLLVSTKSKAYFKEQWGRAIREVNLSRSSNTKSCLIGSSLEHIEETFPSLGGTGLEQILVKEEEELKKDSEALDLLRRQIGDVCRQKIDV